MDLVQKKNAFRRLVICIYSTGCSLYSQLKMIAVFQLGYLNSGPFMSFSDRYINLPDICHQELFLDVQLSLLESFINRLTRKEVENSYTPTGPHYCSVLNAANYVETILQEWNEQVVCSTPVLVFFL